MKKKIMLYGKLFLSTMQISSFTFGGGYVIVPLMRKKFVESYGWINEQEMLDIAAIAQSAPGAIAVNAAILIGYRLAGVMGALVTVVGTILPPMVILAVISIFYTAFRDNAYVSLILKGMQAGVAAVIFDVVWTMGQTIVEQKKQLPIFLMAASFVAAVAFHINIVLIILICGAVGVMETFLHRDIRHSEDK